MSRRERFEDDGRTVADMSGLERPGLSGAFGVRPRSSQRERGHADGNSNTDRGEAKRNPWEDAPFTWKERFRYMGVVLLAALSIGFVFLAGIGLIIWLITLYA